MALHKMRNSNERKPVWKILHNYLFINNDNKIQVFKLFASASDLLLLSTNAALRSRENLSV